jgi:hypothetical protein
VARLPALEAARAQARVAREHLPRSNQFNTAIAASLERWKADAKGAGANPADVEFIAQRMAASQAFTEQAAQGGKVNLYGGMQGQALPTTREEVAKMAGDMKAQMDREFRGRPIGA